jgi:hypothetical protein
MMVLHQLPELGPIWGENRQIPYFVAHPSCPVGSSKMSAGMIKL